ncbi:MAG: hypothetical protein IKB86_02925 [Clostridia bacterium]|nr:hypothetical protein [Clostridia bacterium]
MKRFISLLIILPLLFVGCVEKIEHVEDVSHEIMGSVAIEIPENLPVLTKAIFEAADMTLNQVVNKNVQKKPEFISFEFSSDVMLSADEKALMKNLFSCYNVEITDGLRSSLTDIDRGVTIGFASIEQTQTDDCDLTIPVKIYFGRNIYTYCSDFKLVDNEYVLFRFEYLHRTRYIH